MNNRIWFYLAVGIIFGIFLGMLVRELFHGPIIPTADPAAFRICNNTLIYGNSPYLSKLEAKAIGEGMRLMVVVQEKVFRHLNSDGPCRVTYTNSNDGLEQEFSARAQTCEQAAQKVAERMAKP